jgi:hypothetical protein
MMEHLTISIGQLVINQGSVDNYREEIYKISRKTFRQDE